MAAHVPLARPRRAAPASPRRADPPPTKLENTHTQHASCSRAALAPRAPATCFAACAVRGVCVARAIRAPHASASRPTPSDVPSTCRALPAIRPRARTPSAAAGCISDDHSTCALRRWSIWGHSADHTSLSQLPAQCPARLESCTNQRSARRPGHRREHRPIPAVIADLGLQQGVRTRTRARMGMRKARMTKVNEFRAPTPLRDASLQRVRPERREREREGGTNDDAEEERSA